MAAFTTSILFQFILIILGFALLIAGAKYLVNAAVAIATRLDLSKAFIAMTLIGFGTSLPELIVSVRAVLAGSSGLAIGNVVGSNMINILVILGCSAMIAPITPVADEKKIYVPSLLFCGGLLFLFCFDGEIVFWEGCVFIALLIAFLIYSRVDADHNEHTSPPLKMNLPIVILQALAGMAFLHFGSDWLVSGASTLARHWQVSERVIGLTIVALGTATPEMVTSLWAAAKNEQEIAVGNVLGSNIFNILGVCGAASLVSALTISPDFLRFDLPVLLIVYTIFALLLYTVGKLGRLIGALFLLSYVVYSTTVFFHQ